MSKLLRGRGGLGGSAPQPPTSNGTIAVTVRRGISKRSHEKIGDCEQSTFYIIGEMFRTNVDSVSFCVFIFSA